MASEQINKLENNNDDDEDIEIINLSQKNKPNMTTMLPRSKLFGKTESLLKQIKKSNNELQEKINKMGKNCVIIDGGFNNNDNNNDNIKDNKDNMEKKENQQQKKPYINLDLYLGVLEKKDKKNEEKNVQSTTDKLLGIKTKTKQSIVIEEIDDNQSCNDNHSCNDNEDIDL